jgi:hypothetical protein
VEFGVKVASSFETGAFRALLRMRIFFLMVRSARRARLEP